MGLTVGRVVQTQMKIANANVGGSLSVGSHSDGVNSTDFRKRGSPVTRKNHGHQFQVIRASDFVCYDAEKHLDFEESKRVLQELTLACRKRGLDRAMVDLRDLPVPEKPRFTTVQLVEMAGAIRAAGFTSRQRLAVLHSHDTHGTIRDFVSISRMKGLQVEAFRRFDDAMHWLGSGAENPVEHKLGVEVPIVRKDKIANTKKTKTKTMRKRARPGRWHLARRNKIRTHAGSRPVRRIKRRRL